MIIKKYGIELHRLTEIDLELVRQKRNDESIQKKMFYQKEITPEAQQKWFKSINNIFNYYFIIHYKQNKVGLIHGKVVSFDEKIVEGGIFIWDLACQNSYVPVMASICMVDLTFFVLNMNKSLAQVRMDNRIAIEYNKKLGFLEVCRDSENCKIELELTKENYEKHSIQFRDSIKKIYKDTTKLSWDDVYLTQEELNFDMYKGFPDYIQKEFDKKLNHEKA